MGSNRIMQVVVVEDHPIYRDGLVRALGWSHDVQVVAQAATGRDGLEAAREFAPCTMIADYNLPDLTGVQVAAAINRDGIDCRVLIISAVLDGAAVYRALEAGAAGYIGKDANSEEILDAVLRVSAGQTVLPPAVAGGVANQIRLRAGTRGPMLNDREREILRSFAEGLSIPQVARNLFLSNSTIKAHAQKLYEKLGVSDRAAAVAEAMRRGLLE
ncbi:response regulator transcription factor [Umezawaea sp. Da 62-37]|uniref:response regulator transcription factor n=1 Tax=Umezawaea sp. Da 62-37 TaxID=3075927 RepID=UPI0028F6C956|nr:response regulator transcription factor [Umezawaea sp. Da 62-37]WNV87966.1 response regulator transcription factor [Umezawaea sp. Da 62-37]